jgi:hypothetical protein
MLRYCSKDAESQLGTSWQVELDGTFQKRVLGGGTTKVDALIIEQT